jgi:hypothetical protein
MQPTFCVYASVIDIYTMRAIVMRHGICTCCGTHFFFFIGALQKKWYFRFSERKKTKTKIKYPTRRRELHNSACDGKKRNMELSVSKAGRVRCFFSVVTVVVPFIHRYTHTHTRIHVRTQTNKKERASRQRKQQQQQKEASVKGAVSVLLLLLVCVFDIVDQTHPYRKKKSHPRLFSILITISCVVYI